MVKFFVTMVNSCKSLIIDTKISILVALDVLDLLLCEIKTTKLNKQHISETADKYFTEIYLKMT